jgi:hypothetical protein
MSEILHRIRQIETANFLVQVDALPDYFTDTSFDETGEVADKLESGEYVAFCVRARVIHKATRATLGEDFLGGCIYESYDAFMDHKECGEQNREYERQGESGRCGSYFLDMIREAIREARGNVAQLTGDLERIKHA